MLMGTVVGYCSAGCTSMMGWVVGRWCYFLSGTGLLLSGELL